MSKEKEARVKRQDAARKEMGTHARPGKDVVLDNKSRTEGGSPLHNGRELPAATRAVDLTDEVCDLSPRGSKK